MLYPTEQEWIEAKRQEFVGVANKNNPMVGMIFFELINKKSFEVRRVSDNKKLFSYRNYNGAYNKAVRYKCEVVIV